MGAGESKEFVDLMNEPKLSAYTKTELKEWESRFNERYPNGHITQQQFKDLYEKTHPGNECGTFAGHIYRLFDGNNDNQVSTQEIAFLPSHFKKHG